MPQYDGSGIPLNNQYRKVAASQTTAQISVSADVTKGRDYLDKVIITAASTAAPGAVTIFDGTTSLLAHTFTAASMTDTVRVVELGVVAESTKGFNVTTGSSVSVVCIGRFGG